MTGDNQVRFCEKLRGEILFSLLDSIIRAFESIGDDLGDFLYEKETKILDDDLYYNTKITRYNDFLAEELNLILVESHKQLLAKIKDCLS